MTKLGAEVLAAIDAEPELPGPMPVEMWIQMALSRQRAEEMLRALVRVTKENIKQRVIAVLEGKKNEQTNNDA